MKSDSFHIPEASLCEQMAASYWQNVLKAAPYPLKNNIFILWQSTVAPPTHTAPGCVFTITVHFSLDLFYGECEPVTLLLEKLIKHSHVFEMLYRSELEFK